MVKIKRKKKKQAITSLSICSASLSQAGDLIEPHVTIHIDQKKPILPGEIVTGNVTIVVLEAKRTRGVIIHCLGDAVVGFRKETSSTDISVGCFGRRLKSATPNSNDGAEDYWATEVFADAWRYLLGSTKTKVYVLKPGTQTFAFTFKLPKNLATSYVGEYGRVQYRIELKIKGFGEAKKDYVTTLEFPVFAPLDLTTFPDAFAPKAVVMKKIKKCMKCHLGHIGFLVEIPRGGYLPGEFIDLRGELVNTTSNWTVAGLEIRLLQSDLFVAGDENLWTKKSLCETEVAGIANNTIVTWISQVGPIPDLPSSDLGGCHIIRITYWLQVCLLYRKAYSKRVQGLTEIGEVIIGNIPFDSELVAARLESKDKEEQYFLHRSGLRYRASYDEILGDEPSMSYFVNYSEEAPRRGNGDSSGSS